MGVLNNFRKSNPCTRCNARTTSLDSYVQSITDSFRDSPSYFQIRKNFQPPIFDAWILENSAYKNIVGMKTMIMYPYQEIDSGDYIEWIEQDEVWLTIGSDDQYRWKQKGYIEYCNEKLRWFDSEGKYHEYFCVIEERIAKIGFADNSELPLPENKIQVKVQQNSDTYNIPLNWRFIFGKQVFRVTVRNEYVNSDENDGVLTLSMEKDEENSNDNFTTKIADNGIVTIEIEGGDITNNVGYTQQLNAVVKRDGEVVSGSVSWESSNVNIATVSSSGLLTFATQGSAIITAKLNDATSDSIDVTVQATPTDNYEILISPNNDMVAITETVTYNVKLLNNGVDTGQTFTFTDNTSGSDYVFTVIDGNNFSVKNENRFSGQLEIGINNVNKSETFTITFSPW